MTALGGALYHRRMDAELNRLEHQLEQLIGLYQASQAEARHLHLRVARLEADNRVLSDKLRLATDRFEALLQKLPEG